MGSTDEIPLTPRTRRILEAAASEAGQRGHTFVGTEHLLLAMLGEPECVAYKVLAELDVVDPARVRLLDLLRGAAYAKTSAPVADASLRDELLRRRDVDQAARESLQRMVRPGALRNELPPEALA